MRAGALRVDAFIGCALTAARATQDGDACTVDTCGPDNQCQSRLADQGLLCDDRQRCTSDDRCDPLGACVGQADCGPDNCNEPNGRCCAGVCECDSAWEGEQVRIDCIRGGGRLRGAHLWRQCELERRACVVGDLGCPCTSGFSCDPGYECECSNAESCATSEPKCRQDMNPPGVSSASARSLSIFAFFATMMWAQVQ